AAGLGRAHAALVAAGLDCTLDRRPRLVPHDPALDAARATIIEAWHGHGPGGCGRRADRRGILPAPDAPLPRGNTAHGPGPAGPARRHPARNRSRAAVARGGAAPPGVGR